MTETNYSDSDSLASDSQASNREVKTDLPEFIGDYKVLEKLGEGGFAIVYLAQTKNQDKTEPVALKVLISPESYGRFLREVETIAQLEHPNIIRIFDAGEDDKILTSHGQIYKVANRPEATVEPSSALAKIWGRLRGKTSEADAINVSSTTDQADLSVPYFTMEYIPGGTLREKLETDTFLTIDEALALIKQTGEALSYAHQRGIIHRDVNPNNILLDTRQTPMRPILTDFGLVKPLGPDNNLTMTVGLIGTFHYYAPEQWNRTEITPATDLYALAITFYEILAGKRPFRGDIFSLRDKHLNEPLPPLSEIAPRLGPFYDEVLLKATAKDPLERHESVAAFIEDLEKAQQAAIDDKHYKEIRTLIDREAYDQALEQLDQRFIREGNYVFRDVTRLLWGLVFAKEHKGQFPPDWHEAADLRTRPLTDIESPLVEPITSPPSNLVKWHTLNKYLIPIALSIAMLIGGAIASQFSALVDQPAIAIIALLLLVAYFGYYVWVYYIFPSQDE